MRILILLSLLGVIFIFQVQPVLADGIIIPDPPPCSGGDCPIEPMPIGQLEIRYHHVDVKINEQIAVTRVDQVFINPNPWVVEGTYIFPLPKDAVVTDFILWVDGEPVEASVLSADEARRIYEEIVRQRRDPALLEYIGRGAVQAKFFPLEPGGESRIELQYSQVLTGEQGLLTYTYPLNTEKFSTKPLESVEVHLEISSSQPVRAIYSPSHKISVSQRDDAVYRIGYEETNITPDTDFTLQYSVGENQAFHLFTYRDPRDTVDPDGYFLLLLAPKPGESSQVVAKDVILVLDRSGSMEGEKFQQAQQAARYILERINPEDYFGVVSFSTDIQYYSEALRPASEREMAIEWIENLSAVGSTDINRALLEAANLASEERPAYLIFLTDGLPTEGETDRDDILNNFSTAAPDEVRLFSFGVGYDVDTHLLDSLAEEHHGRSTYVSPGQALDEVISSFYNGITSPVLTDLALNFSGLAVYDLYPNPLPDLFTGSQIVIVGRYKGGGVYDVSLTGNVNGQKQEFNYPDQVFSAGLNEQQSQGNVEIPRLWATRKIGFLLNTIRLNGPNQELIDQIVRLSIRFGIVTPYTSYLITEDYVLGAAAQEDLARETYQKMQAAPEEPAYGQEAVEKAATQGELERSESALGIDESVRQKVRIVGSRTFMLVSDGWVDTGYDPEFMRVKQVAFGSDDYFRLAREDGNLAKAFSLGDHVIAISNGVAYEVVSTSSGIEPTSPLSNTETPVPTLNSEPRTNTTQGGTICPAILLPFIVIFGVGYSKSKRK